MEPLLNNEVYNIKPHRVISQTISVLTFAGMWEKDDQFLVTKLLKKLIHFLIATSLCTALGSGVFISSDSSNALFMAACAIAAALHVVKLIYILTKKDQILSFLDTICVHSLSDFKEFSEVQQKLNNFALFGYVNVSFMACGVFCFLILSLPIFSSEVTLPLNIGFPLDWRNSRTNYWLAHSFVATGVTAAATVSFFTVIYWYIMINCSIKYKILGNQLRTMGERTAATFAKNKAPSMEKEKVFFQYLVQLIESHQNIRNMTSNFKSCFSHLFLAQITTSNLCICCSVYAIVFSSPENYIQFIINCLLLFANTFDLFVVLYLGNEITDASAELLYCVFESDWIDQPKSVATGITIITEVLKKPHELIILKLYPMDLATFTSISKLTYSIFNLLKTFAK